MASTCYAEVVNKFVQKIRDIEKDVGTVLKLEAEEKEVKGTEAQIHKAERLLNQKEDSNRPKRTWFQSHWERMEEQGLCATCIMMCLF